MPYGRVFDPPHLILVVTRWNSQTPLERHMFPIVFAAVVLLPVADVCAKPAGDTSEWTFRARVKGCRIVLPDESAGIGVVYTESAIKEAKDDATLVVGFDAHWLLTLSILDHGNDPLGFKHIKRLKLVVHSPALSLGVDKPKNRDFDLALRYRINERSEYRFVGLQTRQLGDSKPMPGNKAVQPSGDKAAR